MNNLFLKSICTLLTVSMLFVIGCKNEDDSPPPTTDAVVASFQATVSSTNWQEVSFSNFSLNAVSYSWDFGDGNSSTEESPTHTYVAEGDYTITLTATGSDGTTDDKSETITITDPNAANAFLAGTSSKTWHLLREGVALGIGEGVNNNNWWAFGGVTPLAERPCILDDSYTFHADGTWVFESNNTLFVDSDANGGWLGQDESCHDESEPGVFTSTGGDDVSAFGNGGSYTYDYDPNANTITLNGAGAYIGLASKTEAGDNIIPISVKTYDVFHTAEGSIADTLHMSIEITNADGTNGGYWNFYLVSYHNPADLPDIPTDVPPFGEDLDDISPSELFRGFAADDASDFVLLDTIQSGSTVVYGVDDPADASAPKVGQFNRTDAQFQELQFQTSPTKNDINWENLTTVSLDVYLPSSNDYSGSLTKGVIIGLGDRSATAQWWTDHYEWSDDGTTLATDEWITLTYQLDSPNAGAGTGTPYERTDLDMIYIHIGGGDHNNTGTFYVRNLRFE